MARGSKRIKKRIMKKLSVTNLNAAEQHSLKVLQKHYKEKTAAGAARRAIVEQAKTVEYINRTRETKSTKF